MVSHGLFPLVMKTSTGVLTVSITNLRVTVSIIIQTNYYNLQINLYTFWKIYLNSIKIRQMYISLVITKM